MFAKIFGGHFFRGMSGIRSMYRRWKVGASEFSADIARGARLLSWDVNLAGGLKRRVILPPSSIDAETLPEAHGGNPILFPFAGRQFADGKPDFWKGKNSASRPMPMHGFARNSTFEPLEISEDGFCAILVPDDSVREYYPFDFQFRVSYAFSELSLICDLTLCNNSSFPIPWAAGNHFYFALPWIDSTTRADYILNIDAKKQYAYSPDGNLIETDFLKTPQFSDDMVNRIFMRLKTNKFSFGPKSGEENVTVTVGASARPPAQTSVVTWTLSDSSPYFCVEPWMGPPNASSHKNGLSWVGAGESETFSTMVSLA